MVDRTTKLRWRRRIRYSRRQVEGLSVQAEEHLERHFFKRLVRLLMVRRFVGGWVTLMIILIAGVVVQTRALSQYYQKLQPVAGGTFTEGILGTFTNANPLYATSSVDASVAHLLFSGLLRYDSNGRLANGLAEKWTVDARGTLYTVTLKPNLAWHDGKSLNADDVVFTYQTIQNPDAKSPLLNSWRDIKVAAIDPSTISFTLPNSLSSFPHSLTNGIVPKHLLGGMPVSQLRSASFNTNRPVGSGPFKWETIEVRGQDSDSREERIGLVPNDSFYGSVPKLQRFIIRAYHDENRLLNSLKDRELNGVAGLESLPDTYAEDNTIHVYSIPINGQVAVFFKTTQGVLSEQKVRQALVKAVNVNKTIKQLGYPVISANSPFLKSQLGYDKNLVEFPTNIEEAGRLLDEAGWLKGQDGYRTKGGVRLSFQAYSQNTSDYSAVSAVLTEQWRAVGVDAIFNLQPQSELEGSITSHSYDALLFGVSIGPDPDVFPYWHSSQADPRSASRLNLSEYKSKIADVALESGRTRSDPGIRAVKYRPFLETWRNDAPALALYQPRFLYVGYGGIFGFDPRVVNGPTDRYANVENWAILEEKTNK